MSAEVGPQGAARILGGHEPASLSRIEDAGLNASAPPQQRWMDGWLVRTSPGKAQRARCINAVATGRRSVPEKLAECEALYRALQLPLLLRITPFTQPAGLDDALHRAGYAFHDDTRVMVLPDLPAAGLEAPPLPAGVEWVELAPADFAEAVGAMRGSSSEVRRAHAQRLQFAPVPHRAFALTRESAAITCGQIAQEGDLVGLYDIATDPRQQRQGLATWLCKRLLTLALNKQGARRAYLQVGADNQGARSIYGRLGFTDGYSYHYRLAPAVA